MYRKQISQKASPSLRSIPTSKEFAPSPSYGSLSAVVQRAQQDPNSVSEDERQQLESAIGSRSTKEILTGNQGSWIPEFKGISAQMWGNAGQVGVPIQAKGKDDVGVSEVRSENNTGLPNDLKAGVENLSGYSLDNVRVHYNSSKPSQLQALAYTQGTDIHVAPGEEEYLPHEAWHVVQQMQGRVKPTMQMKGVQVNDNGGLEREADVMGKKSMMTGCQNGIQAKNVELKSGKQTVNEGTTAPIQRAIGFEFETQGVDTKKSNANLPNGAFANDQDAEDAWNNPTTRRVKKGRVLLKRNDIEVQADDFPGQSNRSDLEVVTTHFPLDDSGRDRLDNAMTDLTTLITSHNSLIRNGIVTAKALNGTAGFTTKMKDGMFGGRWETAETAPQITFGIRLSNIANIVRDLHGEPGESNVDKTTRNPGRLHMRREKQGFLTEPRDLVLNEEAQTLINARDLASKAIIDYKNSNPSAPGGDALEGFLTIIFTYCEGVQHKSSFLKSHTPLMAKTNLATIFTTLPDDVQTYYSEKSNGKSNLERLVETSPGYDTKMSQPLFGAVTWVLDDGDKTKPVAQQWYRKLTLESWLSGLVSHDRNHGEAFVQHFKDNYGGSKKRPGIDQLTTKAFPKTFWDKRQEVEGYGVLGSKMDKDVSYPTTSLPIFELRSGSKRMKYADTHQWALDLFGYIRSLNENPGGAYTHIT